MRESLCVFYHSRSQNRVCARRKSNKTQTKTYATHEELYEALAKEYSQASGKRWQDDFELITEVSRGVSEKDSTLKQLRLGWTRHSKLRTFGSSTTYRAYIEELHPICCCFSSWSFLETNSKSSQRYPYCCYNLRERQWNRIFAWCSTIRLPK